MAIDQTEYIQTKEKNIKVNRKNKLLFLFDFRIDGKRYRRLFKSKAVAQTPKDLLRAARLELEKQKEMIRSGDISDDVTVGSLFDRHMRTQPDTDWTRQKQRFYDLYIKGHLNSMSVSKVKPLHVEEVILSIRNKGLSPRTCRSVLEVLNPLFKYAVINNITERNPSEHVTVEVPSQKKKVVDGLGTFKKLYSGIMKLYGNNPRHRAIFLFALFGRRKSEILDLKWENINFELNYYWIEDTKNGEDQKFPLPAVTKEALSEMRANHHGLVFKSMGKGGRLYGVEYQVQQLKKETGIEKLTLHYMRNILVSALAEEATEAVTLSGILGHKDVTTINKYLSNSTMKSGLKGLKTIDSILDAEIIEEGDSNE